MTGTAGYAALRQDVAVVGLDRDVIRVSGPQAEEYLQGQLSQDVLALAPGQSALSLLLEPQGKISAFLRVTRMAADAFVLDLDGGFGPAALARLVRFKLRTRADIEAVEGWRCLAVRGPGAPGGPDAGAAVLAAGPGTEVAAPFDWPGLGGVDLLGPDPQAPDGVAPATAADYEVRRIECGLPAMGAELDAGTIPEEAGLVGAAVSFTKGCYTGQELVARIDSRGSNVPRRLRGLVAGPDGAALVPGALLSVDGKEAGVVTSVAASPALGTVGLAYVRRAFEPPVTAEARSDNGVVTVTVRALPLAP